MPTPFSPNSLSNREPEAAVSAGPRETLAERWGQLPESEMNPLWSEEERALWRALWVRDEAGAIAAVKSGANPESRFGQSAEKPWWMPGLPGMRDALDLACRAGFEGVIAALIEAGAGAPPAADENAKPLAMGSPLSSLLIGEAARPGRDPEKTRKLWRLADLLAERADLSKEKWRKWRENTAGVATTPTEGLAMLGYWPAIEWLRSRGLLGEDIGGNLDRMTTAERIASAAQASDWQTIATLAKISPNRMNGRLEQLWAGRAAMAQPRPLAVGANCFEPDAWLADAADARHAQAREWAKKRESLGFGSGGHLFALEGQAIVEALLDAGDPLGPLWHAGTNDSATAKAAARAWMAGDEKGAWEALDHGWGSRVEPKWRVAKEAFRFLWNPASLRSAPSFAAAERGCAAAMSTLDRGGSVEALAGSEVRSGDDIARENRAVFWREAFSAPQIDWTIALALPRLRSGAWDRESFADGLVLGAKNLQDAWAAKEPNAQDAAPHKKAMRAQGLLASPTRIALGHERAWEGAALACKEEASEEWEFIANRLAAEGSAEALGLLWKHEMARPEQTNLEGFCAPFSALRSGHVLAALAMMEGPCGQAGRFRGDKAFRLALKIRCKDNSIDSGWISNTRQGTMALPRLKALTEKWEMLDGVEQGEAAAARATEKSTENSDEKPAERLAGSPATENAESGSENREIGSARPGGRRL